MDVVLVHGAWQGAWCWDRVTPLLRERGHNVLTPTLTGSGERTGELSPAVTLDTHVDDIASVVEGLDDRSVLLVAHSYSGMVISGVAERMPDRLIGLVYIDGFYPYDGDSALALLPPQFQQLFRKRAAEEGDGWRLPANDGLLDVWGLRDPEDRALVRERLTDWSLRCFEAPLQLPHRRLASLPRIYVAGAAAHHPARAAFAPMAARSEADGCRLVELATGHDVMIEAPGDVADILSDAVAQ